MLDIYAADDDGLATTADEDDEDKTPISLLSPSQFRPS